MKKVIFKGVINGVEFDTLDGYNQEIDRLAAEGCNNIVASTSTQIEEVPDVENCDCDCNCNECQYKEPEYQVNLVPMFDTNEHYLDRLVGQDSNENVAILNDLKTALPQWTREITSALRTMSKTDLMVYLKSLDNIIESITVDRNDTSNSYLKLDADIQTAKEELRKTEHNLNSLQNRMNVLNDCHPIMDSLQEFYENLRATTYDLINPAPEKQIPLPQEATTTSGFSKWLDRVFGDK